MKFFRKINLGVIALLIVVISVAVYMIYMNGKHNDLGKKADDFLTSFFESDADWATIPEEYRKDSKSYIESIEKDAKKYFCDDGAYDYYIKNAKIIAIKNPVKIPEVRKNFTYLRSFSIATPRFDFKPPIVLVIFSISSFVSPLPKDDKYPQISSTSFL